MENQIAQELPSWFGAGMILFIIALIAWSTVWKAIALWKAARNGSRVWYMVLFLINTVGILEIIYIFAVAKKTEISQTINSPAPKP